MSWNRLKSVVRGAQAAIESEPKTLAPLRPLIQDALELLSKPATEEAKEELAYLLTKIQEFVIPWRPSSSPSPDILYFQPNWAKSTDDNAGEALAILRDLPPMDMGRPEATSIDMGSTAMKVFVSHSSIDKPAAGAFVDLLRAALNLPAKEIRCTRACHQLSQITAAARWMAPTKLRAVLS